MNRLFQSFIVTLACTGLVALVFTITWYLAAFAYWLFTTYGMFSAGIQLGIFTFCVIWFCIYYIERIRL